MKPVILLFMLLTGTHILCAFGQTGTDTAKSRVKELIEKIEKGDNKAILELGLLGDKCVIPYLQKLLQEPNKNFGSASANAQMALAKLGEKKQLDEILNELHSDDPGVQDDVIKKLTYVGGNEVIKALVKLLDDSQWRLMKGYDPNRRGPKGEIPQGKVFYLPLSFMAMKALSQIVSDPPVSPQVEPSEDHIRIWREWLDQNKDLLK